MVNGDVSGGVKCTPIQLKYYDRNDTQMIRNNLDGVFAGKYVWRQLNPNYPARIYANDDSIKATICGFLTNNGVEYNSFTNKTICVVT